jgi:hypothetical protein
MSGVDEHGVDSLRGKKEGKKGIGMIKLLDAGA